jgi:thiamine-phosphate pyrophosphorylase
MSPNQVPLRILDASLNRATEGLRVVEDYVRFVLDDAHLTEQFKQLRHELAAAGAALPLPQRYAARDTQQDVGATITTTSEVRRVDAWDVCVASFERVKQSLRSLEEFSKVATPQAATVFEALRYRLYTLEAAAGRTADAMRRLADVRLYVLIDGGETEDRFAALVHQLVAAGVGAIQIRDKRLDDRLLITRARLLIAASRLGIANPSLRGRGIMEPLVIINDRPDIAEVVDADGLHLGQDDMSVKDARAVVGPQKLIGVSTHSIEQARAAVLAGANYIGVGPTFPSTTKKFDAFPGVELLRQVAVEIRLPAFAIGGITMTSMGEVLAAGFTRVAVGSAVTHATHPGDVVSKMRSALGPVAAG